MATLTFHAKVVWCICLVGLWSLSGVLVSQAQTGPGSAPAEEPLPLNITADRLEVEQNQQVITFIKNVVARYKDMILYAETLKIYYQSKTQSPSGQETPLPPPSKAKGGPPGAEGSPLGAVGIEKIIRIEALGKVRMVQGDRVATGDKAIYYTQEDKLVLLGNPQLWRGENSLRGHEIIFYVKDNRAVVESEPHKRVEAVIYPSQKVQLPGSKPPAGAPKR